MEGELSAAALDCWKPLPSGLSTLERFKLGKSISSSAPVAFTVSNLQQPRLVPLHLTASTAAVSPLVDHVRAATRARLAKVSTSLHLSSCLGNSADRVCALLMLNRTTSGGENGAPAEAPEDKLSTWLQPILNQQRTVQFAVMNSAKRQLQSRKLDAVLSALPELPASTPSGEVADVILFKRVLVDAGAADSSSSSSSSAKGSKSSKKDKGADGDAGKKKPRTTVVSVSRRVRLLASELTAAVVEDWIADVQAAANVVSSGASSPALPAHVLDIGSALPDVGKRAKANGRKPGTVPPKPASKKKKYKKSEEEEEGAKPDSKTAGEGKAARRKAARDSQAGKSSKPASGSEGKKKQQQQQQQEKAKAAEKARAQPTELTPEQERARRERLEAEALESGVIPEAVDVFEGEDGEEGEEDLEAEVLDELDLDSDGEDGEDDEDEL